MKTKADVRAIVETAVADGAPVITVAAPKARKPRGAKAKDVSTDAVPAHLQALADAALGEDAFVGPMPLLTTAFVSVPASGARLDGFKMPNVAGKMLVLTDKCQKMLGINTRQGAGLKLGKGWYKEGPVGTSLRYQALELVLEKLGAERCEEGFTAEEFKAALAGSPILEGRSPARFLRSFLKWGYAELAA